MQTDLEQAQAAARAGVTLFTEKLLQSGQPKLYRRLALEIDRAVLSTVLRHVHGNQSLASELLGISRTTFRARLRAAGLSGDNK